MHPDYHDEADIYHVEGHPYSRAIGATWLAIVLILAIFASCQIFERMF